MTTFNKILDVKDVTRVDWLNARKIGIGGSDMAAIMGLNKWRSAVDVWLDKTGQIVEEQEENEFMYWGNVLEEVVAKEFERRTNLKVRRNNFMLQSVEFPFLLANLDREIVGQKVGLECKTASAFKSEEWEGDSVPDIYYIQCQHYMAVTGYCSWWIACLCGGNSFFFKEIPRNEEVIALIIEKGKEFWQHVTDLTMPDITGQESCKKALTKLYPDSNGESVNLPDTATIYIEQYNRASEAEKAAGEQKLEAQNILTNMLGVNEIGFAGDFKVSWKNTKPRETFDGKKLKADYPEIAKNYIKIGEASRKFSIK